MTPPSRADAVELVDRMSRRGLRSRLYLSAPRKDPRSVKDYQATSKGTPSRYECYYLSVLESSPHLLPDARLVHLSDSALLGLAGVFMHHDASMTQGIRQHYQGGGRSLDVDSAAAWNMFLLATCITGEVANSAR